MFKGLTFKKAFIFLLAAGVIAVLGFYTLEKNRSQSGLPGNRQQRAETLPEQPKPDSNAQAAAPISDPAAEQKAQELEAKYQLAYNAFFGHKYVEAVKLADEIIRQDNKNYKAYNIKGITLAYSGKFNNGMENIDKALELKPDFGYARFNKALAYELNGQYDLALKWYDKNLEVENYVWSYYGKASIYGRRGDVPNTVKFLKLAIQLDPDAKETAREEADFNPVRSSKEFQALLK